MRLGSLQNKCWRFFSCFCSKQELRRVSRCKTWRNEAKLLSNTVVTCFVLFFFKTAAVCSWKTPALAFCVHASRNTFTLSCVYIHLGSFLKDISAPFAWKLFQIFACVPALATGVLAPQPHLSFLYLSFFRRQQTSILQRSSYRKGKTISHSFRAAF